MSRKISELENDFKEVINTELISIAEDNQELLVALLYASHAMETQKLLRDFAKDSMQAKAATLCFMLHTDEVRRNNALKHNFFSDNLKAMLNIALANPIYGARMMPIFCNYMVYADDHNLNEDLKLATIEVMEHLRATFGFAIREITDESIDVVGADDVHFG